MFSMMGYGYGIGIAEKTVANEAPRHFWESPGHGGESPEDSVANSPMGTA